MDKFEALEILGFEPYHQPSIDDIEEHYANQLANAMKESFGEAFDPTRRQRIDEARSLLIGAYSVESNSHTALQASQNQSLVKSPENQQNLEQFHQKPQASQSPIPMIQVSDFSVPHRTNLNYLQCPFCSNEVAEGILICPKCNNQVARNCPTCATWISVISQSCPACGTPVALTSALKFARSEAAIQTLQQERSYIANYKEKTENENKEFVTKSWLIWLSLTLLIVVIILIIVLYD